jgi:uncharacterized protein DUF6597/helix-turn-helix protein
MSVTEYPPPAALAPFVDAFWSRAPGRSAGSVGPERILPDGCLDIVVGPRAAIVVGAMTRSIVVPPADGAGMIGVRFRPGMATAFLRIRRVVRLWKVLRSTAGGRVNWAGLAADLGYSDQSHLVTEFRSLTGVTPSRWIASRRPGSKSPSRQGVGSLP